MGDGPLVRRWGETIIEACRPWFHDLERDRANDSYPEILVRDVEDLRPADAPQVGI
jgi:hypothetical protein